MEEQIKDFDRNIEKAMNEYSATPPFGMWNRISAELDVVAPAAATATSAATTTGGTLFSKLGFGILILAAALESAFLVNYVASRNASSGIDTETAVLNNRAEQEQAPVQLNAMLAKAKNAIAEKSEPVLKASAPVTPVAKKEIKPVLAKNENKAEEIAAPSNNEAAGKETLSPQAPATALANAIVQPADMYFFPPVDINTSSEEKQEAKTEEVNTTPVAAKTVAPVAEKKAKVSSSSDRKFRWRPTKRPKWHYGKLNSRK